MLNNWLQLGLVSALVWFRFYPSSLLLLALGVVLAVVTYLTIVIKLPFPQTDTRLNHSRFNFTKRVKWEKEIKLLKNGLSNDSHAIVVSDDISVLLSDLLDLVINEFIQSWFSQISSSPLFSQDVKCELSHVSKCIVERIQKIDFAKLITLKLLPIFNDHYLSFAQAQKSSMMVKDTSLYSDAEGVSEVLSHFNNGNLHVGVTLSQVDKKERNFQEKAYLRGQIRKLLTKTLSDRENSNEVVVLFITEVLACTILDNVFNLVADPDFLNMQIIKLIGDSLKRRNQVKELRSALEEHTMTHISVDDAKSQDRAMDRSEAGLKEMLTQEESGDGEQTVIHLNNEMLKSSQKDKLVVVLKSPSESMAFGQYLKSKNKLHLLDFWRKVEESKSPLLDSFQESGELSITERECVEIREKYFNTGLISIGIVDLENFKILGAAGSFEHRRCLQACKDVLMKLQGRIFQYLFTEYYSKFLLSEASKFKRNSTVGEGESVVDQIEDKLANIMSDPKYDMLENYADGMTSQIIGSELNEKAVFNRNDRYSRLFEDEESSSDDDEESDGLDTDSDSVIMKESTESMELAGPGNLNLAEKIPTIEKEIENLRRQLIYLEPLIRKAQLTNNQSKLKVLLKSKNGVQRDIALKELQKSQYIVQESDNTLFGKSKVSISSVVHENEKAKEFVLYIVEVQKFSSEEPDVVKAGWVVARRYSQFHRLHGYLKRRYPQVSSLNFPQKSISVLKFQQKNITETRRHQLEAYLRALIEIPEVCSDKAFRSFLSSENFQLGKHQRFDEPKKLSALFGYKWYLGSSNNRSTINCQYSSTATSSNGGILENRREMEKELRQFDEKPTSKPLFIKPICDIVISIFNLHWLKGRALVVILQQFFGTAVENKVYEIVDTHFSESNVGNVLTMLRNLLFPDGKFKLEPETRSRQQKLHTYREANQLFDTFMTETWSRIFGSENTANAATTLFSMLQINQLNRHLLFQVFDEVLDEVYNK
ncbi:TRM8 [Candida margitis]|uniref:TRM8 n=1 Tax=Candida margitis TaxID=1775924 RepID=UPI002226E101|nr:TRM8 [Candida margitis]KAI5967744.1 TRM8 [Candida margitis]